MAASARHETRALLRAHLAAASSYRHLTRHCPICHQLLRLAMDSVPPPADHMPDERVEAAEPAEPVEDGSPSPA
ncbi:hypothetical protein BN159_4706 [Streptomyces davaonensis JCM 4913]|uniref:Uncharacterized protein n=1 Tax=Streptomyces davaonensis (strain DSM 101723 / JCM 4913 / KCC S-0913 / 768) TaxID=1214101 RepID=K4R7N1_STRDJ|nr:DUF6274 family protein [Streptomyces davaonensis]CCK29085.1 hypothetical protein BN159_4706 [Streptomyces davaonensis JCM 4913]